MEFFIFKLNLEPVVLNIYSNDKLKLNECVIPNDLSSIFNKVENKDKTNLVHYVGTPLDVKLVKENSEYIKMIENLDILLNMFGDVNQKFNDEGEILYTQKYLALRKELDRNIKSVFNAFPIIEFQIIDMKNIYNIKAFSNIQMGVTYLQRAGKIKSYIENYDSERITRVEFYYDKATEQILIEKSNLIKDDSDATEHAATIEELINKRSDKTNIKNITINPIYDFSSFEGQYARIKLVIVFPNGSAAKARSMAIEEVEAATEIREFLASKGEKIDLRDFEPIVNHYANQGYLRELLVSGKRKLIGKIKKRKINVKEK